MKAYRDIDVVGRQCVQWGRNEANYLLTRFCRCKALHVASRKRYCRQLYYNTRRKDAAKWSN